MLRHRTSEDRTDTEPEQDEVIDLNALSWEESARLVEFDDDVLAQEMIDRRQDTVAPSASR